MEEVYGAGPENLQTNFRVEELISTRNISRYFPLQKKSAYVKTKTRQFYAVILNVCWCVYITQMFFMCARNSDEYFTKFISNKFLNVFRFIFYSIVDQNFKMKDYTNLNNCHNCFFMPCSYKITCHIKYFFFIFWPAITQA